MRLAGPDVGSPVLAFPNQQRGIFGPIVSPAPTGRDALRIWDATVTLMDLPDFFELKRGWTGLLSYAWQDSGPHGFNELAHELLDGGFVSRCYVKLQLCCRLLISPHAPLSPRHDDYGGNTRTLVSGPRDGPSLMEYTDRERAEWSTGRQAHCGRRGGFLPRPHPARARCPAAGQRHPPLLARAQPRAARSHQGRCSAVPGAAL